jgi:peptidoglycan/LPS O-acetylase OafA/YrhL
MSPILEAPRPGEQIPALTGVRAIAAFLVFFHHHPTDLLTLGPLLLWWELHIGVTLFFVLSGFMITWRYDGRQGPRQPYLRGYFVNRFARIYPLYLALVVPTMLLRAEKSPLVWGLNLTVFTCFDSGIAQAWSLRVEECFYLLAPAIFLLWRRGPAWPLGAAAILLAALYPVAMLPAAAGILGPPREFLLYTFPGRFFEFYAGIWLAKRLAGAAPPDPGSRRSPVFTLLGGLGIAAVVVALAALHHAAGTAYLYGLYHPAGIVLNNLVLPVFIAAFYWGLVREPSVLRRILSGRVAALLGRSSYAFYLIHTGPLLAYLLGVFALGAKLLGPRAGAAAERLPAQPGALFLFVILLSIGLYRFIERPANRFLRRRWGSPAEAPRR